MDYQFIAIEGNIGSGKTSLAKKLATQFNAKLVLERFSDNPFLPKFYKEPKKYAFALELSFLAERYRQLKEKLIDGELFSEFTVSDYLISKCAIFARTNLKDDEYDLFMKLYHIMYASLPQPDILLYLHLDVDKLQQRIHKRGRAYEQSISNEYLEKIQEGYFSFFRSRQELKILMVDYSNADFINNKEDFIKLLEALEKKYQPGIHRILL